MNTTYHIPVLLQSSIDGINIRPDGTYVDLTFGGGGHSRAILEKLNNGRLIVFDQDEDAWENRIDDSRVEFVRHNFRYLYQFLKYLEAMPVDGILADLGVSSHHFDAADRGFSFRFDADLDMRMNKNQSFTAADILNTYSEKQLITVFKLYGEISSSRRLVSEIINYRNIKPLKTTWELKELASKLAPRKDAARFYGQVFQALRIEVNGEMEALKEMLESSYSVLKPGGRLVIISYHSLEDRMVKNFMRTGNVEKSQPETDIFGHANTPFKVVTRKVIVPEEEEVSLNPRARSAKLRIAERAENV
ncbi:16S rRNA (cytosine(1402)-N(4))-methyltransferase RsmH [Alkalitalea saponilacus]|uniref:Ribosomal RNA small subunit methyltransferase H n=1 Tax=Alkalitalea saponilacus TaxID=889453 RepID=A0A1T5HRC1_9BACT|nr:16S rRNA (cytosine(1402)-N(4))-methyltransferase RsmH [Alkalitalea saponilacus]ASB48401.1 16S rRNA (cytosine(1402)-N(4))-methyltransferase [Alkalitalea saponilacus]SKC23090.1 16S rRNA (cytosine1402-N4)-methyltransferase [Alkalitalea saponilacus]